MTGKKSTYRVMREPNDPRFVEYGIPVLEDPIPTFRQNAAGVGTVFLLSMVSRLITGN